MEEQPSSSVLDEWLGIESRHTFEVERFKDSHMEIFEPIILAAADVAQNPEDSAQLDTLRERVGEAIVDLVDINKETAISLLVRLFETTLNIPASVVTDATAELLHSGKISADDHWVLSKSAQEAIAQ